MRTPLIALLFLSFAAIPALAYDCRPGENPVEYPANFKLKKITGYIPKLGGINGGVGKSASGVDASKHSFENFKAGKSDFVMVAVPQRGEIKTKHGGERSRFFKSMVRVPAVEKAAGLGKCILFFAGDHYAKSSNWAGEFGKMDMVHEPPYKNAMLFNNLQNAQVFVVSGVQTVKNKRFKIERLLDAMVPLVRPTPKRSNEKGTAQLKTIDSEKLTS